MILIAEVKTLSPFGYRSDRSWFDLFRLATQHGDMVSIHTDARWDGSYSRLSVARKLTKKPILAKGIHSTDHDVESALRAGADRVLVVGRLPDSELLPWCYLEPMSLAELSAYPPGVNVVWNARDLATGLPKQETFSQARAAFDGFLVQASFIRSRADVHPEAHAVLVGEHLPEFAVST